MNENLDHSPAARPRVTLDQWLALVAVADSGGFRQAAERLHRSQSSVSYAVGRLQDQLGVKLFGVQGRRAVLTESGAALVRRARRLLEDSGRLEAMAASVRAGWEPEIRLVVDAAFPTGRLMLALERFAPDSGGTRVQLREEVLSGTIEALVERRADLVISHTVPQGFLGDFLLDVEFVAVAHASHALHGLDRTLTPDDLGRETQVVVRDTGVRMEMDHGWLGAEHRWTVTGLETAHTMVARGLGFGWLPRHRVRPDIERGILLPLPLERGQTRRHPLYLVFGMPDQPGPATATLAAILRDAVGEP